MLLAAPAAAVAAVRSSRAVPFATGGVKGPPPYMYIDNLPADNVKWICSGWAPGGDKTDVKLCGANIKRRGVCCKHPAGYGTAHLGLGRCKWHGGTT